MTQSLRRETNPEKVSAGTEHVDAVGELLDSAESPETSERGTATLAAARDHLLSLQHAGGD